MTAVAAYAATPKGDTFSPGNGGNGNALVVNIPRREKQFLASESRLLAPLR